MMLAHLPVRLIYSPWLRSAGVKGVSVLTYGPEPAGGWSEVPQAAKPEMVGGNGNAGVPANAALSAQAVADEPVPPAPARVASSLTLIEGGATPSAVIAALAMSVRAVR